MSFVDMDWSVVQALVAAGHVLPKPINAFAVKHHAFNAPMSVVRWLLQQGMTLEGGILLDAARAGRLDVLQLAQNMHIPITVDEIHVACSNSHWEVLSWACRHGVPVDWERLQKLLLVKGLRFKSEEQKTEVISLFPAHKPFSPDYSIEYSGITALPQRKRTKRECKHK